METYEIRATSAAGRVKSASVSLALNQTPQVSAEVYGTTEPDALTLSVLKDGVEQSSTVYPLTGDGSGGLDLQTGPYRGAQNEPVDFGLESGPTAGVENVPFGTGATLDDFFANVNTVNPNAGTPTETTARNALENAGYNLVVIDGPGIWRAQPEGANSAFENTGTLEYLQSTLLKTGARWWLSDNTFYIDGSAAPYGFALPESDKHLITAYSWQDETVTVDEPVTDEPPDREQYLSQCPDYEPPEGYEEPEKTPETIMQGKFTYTSAAGSGAERVEFTRINYYNKRLLRTVLIENGTIQTPDGPVFGLRSKSTTEFDHHPMCKEAVTREHTTVYAANEMSTAGDNTDVEEARATYYAAGGATPFLQSDSVIERIYHSSGYLKEETETIRELDVLSLKSGPDGPTDFRRVYNTRTRQVVNEPNAGGRWVHYVTERQTENIVVYERGEVDPETGRETAGPARVQRVSRVTARAEPTDGAPAQLTCSPPEPPDPDAPPDTAPCEDKREYEYQKALTEWRRKETLKTDEYQSRLANLANQPKRVHSITLGVPRPDIALNQLYGNGLVAAVSVTYADDGANVQAGTSLTVWERK